MLDRALIDHASPTLARLKVGNLFNYPIGKGFRLEYTALRKMLSDKGVTMSILRIARGKALIYVYRAAELEKALSGATRSASQSIKGCLRRVAR